jgi:anti-anti-sigma factor
MTMAVQGEVTLGVQGDLAISSVRAVAIEWLEKLLVPGPVVVACGGLGRVDTAGLQLLVSVRRTCAAGHRTLRWQDPSPSLLQTAERCGLSEELKFTVGA